MFRPLLVAIVISYFFPHALGAQEISSPTEYRQQAFDVLSYDVYLDLTKAPAPETSGQCEMLLRWTGDPSGGFFFHLRSLEIDSVFYDGVPADARPVGTEADPTYHFVVPSPSSAAVGDTARIRVHYHGTMTNEGGAFPWGGVSSDNGVLYALGVGFNTNYVSTTEHWMPCYDHPSDKATFRGQFLARKPNVVASNGRSSVADLGDSTVMYIWNTDIPTATYLLTFACGPYSKLEMTGASAPIELYSLAPDTAATRVSFTLLPRMIQEYESRFGPYPFEKVGYCNTLKGAMEHQTMISYPVQLARSRDTVNSTGAHELSHQWFGDLVSPLDYRHAWLNESFATWCESVWEEALGGFPRYLVSQERKMSSYIASDSRNEGIIPLFDFPRTSPSSNYPSTIYRKGALVVGMLRYELGDSLFFAAVRAYLTRHAYSTATTDDMQSIMEEYAGRPLGWFFDQWVRRPGWPVYSVDVRRDQSTNGMYRAHITLTQTPNGTTEPFVDVPVEIGFRDSENGFVYRVVRASGPETIAEFDSLPDFRQVTINKGPSLRALLQAPQVQLADADGSSGTRKRVRVRIMPNPVVELSSEINVALENVPECRNIRYVLYDTAGRQSASGITSQCEFRIPVEDLDAGMYILHLEHSRGMNDVPVMVGR